jgi:hypothetical protein
MTVVERVKRRRANSARVRSSISTRTTVKPVPAKWILLVYMAGDNNLQGAGKSDLAEMKRVGSSPNLQIIVQFDTRSGTTRYRVEKNSVRALGTFAKTNTGSAKTLSSFIRWALAEYPAEHVILDVWNHGGGWENLPKDFDYESLRSTRPARAGKLDRLKHSVFRTSAAAVLRQSVEKRAIAIDVGAHDYLDNQELRSAIETGLGRGRKLDILGMDACLMNMLEIAYELKDVADYQVGSEQSEPEAGWPYAAILRELAKSPSMTPADLSKTVVARYASYYQRAGDATTHSAFDLSKASTANGAVDELAAALLANLDALAGPLLLARQRALSFQEYPEYLDLVDFTNQLDARVPHDAGVRAATARVRQALGDGFVLANATTGASMKRAHGVSIYFPADRRSYSTEYRSLAFARHNRWPELLEKLFDL